MVRYREYPSPRQSHLVARIQVSPKLWAAAQHFAQGDCRIRRDGFLARTISLITCGGRASRAASSRWVIPRAASSSARISPGGIGRSEYTRGGLVVIMSLTYSMITISSLSPFVTMRRQRPVRRIESSPLCELRNGCKRRARRW